MKKLLFVLLLAGCATQQPERPKTTIYEDAERECKLYGFEKGTEAYGNCMQREVQHRKEVLLRLLPR